MVKRRLITKSVFILLRHKYSFYAAILQEIRAEKTRIKKSLIKTKEISCEKKDAKAFYKNARKKHDACAF